MTNTARSPWPILALVALALAGGPTPAGADGPKIVVLTLDESPAVGTLEGLDATGVDLATGGRSRRVDLDAVVAISFPAAGRSELASGAHLRVLLTGGERLLGTWGGPAPDGIRLDVPGAGAVAVPFDAVRTIVPVPADSGPCHEPENRYPADETNDVVYTRSGDAYQGILLGAREGGVELETEAGRSRVIPLDELLVVHLQNPVPDPTSGLAVEIETVDGARFLTSDDLGLEGEVLGFSTRSLPGQAIRLALTQVRTVRASGGRFSYATELPYEEEFEPYYRDDGTEGSLLERWYAARVDRRPTGCPLRLDGTTYRHGFAVHSRSRVRLPLDGGWSRFRAVFGVDDEALEIAAGGIVDARVLADGKVVWEARDVKAGTAPRRIGPLDVAGVRELVLVVDYGAELHVRDRATWADPLLERP